MGGNFYGCNIQMGRYDADYGKLLINKGKGEFAVTSLGQLPVTGQIKRMATLQLNGKQVLVIARNDDTVLVVDPEKTNRATGASGLQ